MKRNLIIGAVAAFALAAPAGSLAASSGSHSSIDRVKVENRDVSSHDRYTGERQSRDVRSKDASRDRYAGDRSSRDVKSKADAGSTDRSKSGWGHDTSSTDTSSSQDGGFDR